jgi:hypothetical protein
LKKKKKKETREQTVQRNKRTKNFPLSEQFQNPIENHRKTQNAQLLQALQ